jgi:hypothetical protein
MEELKISKKINEEDKTITINLDFGSYHYSYNGMISNKQESDRIYAQLKAIQTVVNQGMKEQIENIENRYETEFNKELLYYERKELETLKEKILQDLYYLNYQEVKIEGNVCYASYNDIEKILDKRFGF